MKCSHCAVCRKSGKCTLSAHACDFFRKQAEKDIKPVKWRPAARR